MTSSCPRLFEVEAMRDGRLTGPELASFARHMTACRACAQEAQALDRLARAVRAGAMPDPPEDELAVARQRTRLLAEFDRGLLASGRRARRWWPGLAAAAALVGALLVAPRARPPVAPVVQPPAVVVHPADGAVWSKQVEGGAERILLAQGTLAIHVDHVPSRSTRLVVVLPDGELEDVGTTFAVTVVDGRTQQVAVQEGRVRLRIRGLEPVALDAGQTWRGEAPAAPPVAASPAAPKLRRGSPVIARLPPRRNPDAPQPDEPPQSREFRALVGLLEGGDGCAAAARAAQFVASYPSDPRVEDAAYLRVVGLQRCGSADDMKRAARDYLRRFPAAFRRAEVERLLR